MPDRPRPDHVRGPHTTDKTAPLEPSGFATLGLDPRLLRNVERQGWPLPTPIQAEVIPRAIAGHDVLGIAQTGTGKTAAFALPVLQRLLDRPKAKPLHPYAVVLAPTRELVQQIQATFTLLAAGTPIKVASVFGGVADRPQISALNSGVEVVIAAPGRLMDLMGRGWVNFTAIEFCILDEADRMLDMGFIMDIRKILNRMPSRKQMLLLSATLAPEIKKLSAEFLYHPQEVTIGATGPPAELRHELWEVAADDKPTAMDKLLAEPHDSILVFTRTRHGADKLARRLLRDGLGPVGLLHADRSQSQRDKALAQFRSGEVRTLVATDVASRGLDVTGIELVINYDVPRDAEDYVHRVGRTARAKRPGIAVTLVTPEENKYIKKIEQLVGKTIDRQRISGEYDEAAAAVPRKSRSGSGRGRTAFEEKLAAKPRVSRREEKTAAEKPFSGRQPRPGRRDEGAAGTAEAAPRAERAPRPEGAPRPERAPRVERPSRDQARTPRPPRTERRGPETDYVEEPSLPNWQSAGASVAPERERPARSDGPRSAGPRSEGVRSDAPRAPRAPRADAPAGEAPKRNRRGGRGRGPKKAE
jgi:ATP-dependent RNA helicase RhlE